MNEMIQAIHCWLEQLCDTAAEIGAALEANELDLPALALAQALVALDKLAGDVEGVRDRLAGVDAAEVVGRWPA
jgi:hypothetical protein